MGLGYAISCGGKGHFKETAVYWFGNGVYLFPLWNSCLYSKKPNGAFLIPKIKIFWSVDINLEGPSVLNLKKYLFNGGNFWVFKNLQFYILFLHTILTSTEQLANRQFIPYPLPFLFPQFNLAHVVKVPNLKNF